MGVREQRRDSKQGGVVAVAAIWPLGAQRVAHARGCRNQGCWAAGCVTRASAGTWGVGVGARVTAARLEAKAEEDLTSQYNVIF